MLNPSNEILNAATGELTLSDSLTISPTTKPSDILNHFTISEVKAWDTKEGHSQWHTIRNFFINSNYFIFRLYFLNEVLKQIHFVISIEEFKKGSWDAWTEEQELKKQLFFDGWLTEQIGTQRSFSWGHVISYYDSKGGSSLIVLRYT